MEESELAPWPAKGLLQPYWDSHYSGKARREQLAAAVGTAATVLSAINSGRRPLGQDLAQRLAVELGITIYDLGAPATADSPQAPRSVIDRLEELAGDVAALLLKSADQEERIRHLENERERMRARSRRRGAGPA